MGQAAMNLPLNDDSRCSYGFGTVKNAPFDSVIERLIIELGKRHYQVVANIDMQQILEQGSGALFPRYRILCVCNPTLISRAFAVEPTVGLFFPCHVAVYEDYQHRIQVKVHDPLNIMDHLRHPAAIEAAIVIKEQLENLLEEF